MKHALWIRAVAFAALALLAACGHGGNGPATVGVGIGVALTAPSGTTIVAQGGTIEIDATVSNDPSNAGVSWTLSGSGTSYGSLTTQTNAKAVYQAPNGVVGSIFVTLTATSLADTTKASAVTITINGTPQILQPTLFPAHQNIAYGTYISVAGGTAPYTWSVSAGTLPAGLALSGTNAATTAITGTPSTLGSSTFTLLVTDSAGLTAQIQLTITVVEQTACLLTGQYAYLLTGFYQGKPVTRAGSVNVSTTGSVTGVHDYKDATNVRPNTVLTGGACLISASNYGKLQISSNASGNESFDYVIRATLQGGHLQQNDGTTVLEAGEFYQQDTTAFNLAALAGDWVFGAVGADGSGARLAVAGRITLDGSGNVQAGSVGDTTGAAPVTNAAVAGTLTAPDANGRGTAALTVGAQALPIAFYVVDQNTLLIVTSDTSATTPRVAGRMTRQTGAGTLDSTVFATGSSVLSLWGSSLVSGVASATMSVGRLYGAAATAGSASGTLSLDLDVADRGAQSVNSTYSGAPYTLAANGRGTLSFGSGSAQRAWVVYSDGAGGGYVVEPGSAVGNFGIFEAQAAGPYSDFSTAYYVGGTLFAGATSPISQVPQLVFSAGTIGGDLSGSYAIDPTTGRMVAGVTRTIFGGSDLVIYIVSQDKLVMMGDSLNISNSQIAWLEHY
ncbi:MAG: hypothetical protein JSR54_07205 [Proteobacteria bacterium]|nr:hypothetical protein [Pseudomonadota bacterium]